MSLGEGLGLGSRIGGWFYEEGILFCKSVRLAVICALGCTGFLFGVIFVYLLFCLGIRIEDKIRYVIFLGLF